MAEINDRASKGSWGQNRLAVPGHNDQKSLAPWAAGKHQPRDILFWRKPTQFRANAAFLMQTGSENIQLLSNWSSHTSRVITRLAWSSAAKRIINNGYWAIPSKQSGR